MWYSSFSLPNTFKGRLSVYWYVVGLCSIGFCDNYHSWSISSLLATIKSHKLDPSGVYYALEAMKHRSPREAKAVFDEYKMSPSQLDNVLRELDIGIFEAYYNLKQWIGDIADDTSDEKVFSKLTPFEALRAMQIMRYSPKQIDDEMGILLNQGPAPTKPTLLAINLYRVIENFFGKDNYYSNWKNKHPEAFRSLKEIYDNNENWKPLPAVTYFTTKSKLMKMKLPKRIWPKTTPVPCSQGFGHTYPSSFGCAGPEYKEGNQITVTHRMTSTNDMMPPVFAGTMSSKDLPPGYSVQEPQIPSGNDRQPPPPQVAQDHYDLHDQQFENSTRYERLHDEMHVYNKMKDDKEDIPAQTIYHIRRYYDTIENVVIESKKTIEHHHLDNGSYRKVHKDVTRYDPNKQPGKRYLDARSVRPKAN